MHRDNVYCSFFVNVQITALCTLDGSINPHSYEIWTDLGSFEGKTYKDKEPVAESAAPKEPICKSTQQANAEKRKDLDLHDGDSQDSADVFATPDRG